MSADVSRDEIHGMSSTGGDSSSGGAASPLTARSMRLERVAQALAHSQEELRRYVYKFLHWQSNGQLLRMGWMQFILFWKIKTIENLWDCSRFLDNNEMNEDFLFFFFWYNFLCAALLRFWNDIGLAWTLFHSEFLYFDHLWLPLKLIQNKTNEHDPNLNLLKIIVIFDAYWTKLFHVFCQNNNNKKKHSYFIRIDYHIHTSSKKKFFIFHFDMHFTWLPDACLTNKLSLLHEHTTKTTKSNKKISLFHLIHT